MTQAIPQASFSAPAQATQPPSFNEPAQAQARSPAQATQAPEAFSLGAPVTQAAAPSPQPEWAGFAEKAGSVLGGALFGAPGAAIGGFLGEHATNPNAEFGLGDLGKLAGTAIGGMAFGPLGAMAGSVLGEKLMEAPLALKLGGLGGLGGPPQGVTPQNLGAGLPAMSSVFGGAPAGSMAQSSSNPNVSSLALDGLVASTNLEHGYTSLFDPETNRYAGTRFGEAAVLDPNTGSMSFVPISEAMSLGAMGVPTSVAPAQIQQRQPGPQEIAQAYGVDQFPSAPRAGGGIFGGGGLLGSIFGGGRSSRTPSYDEMSSISPGAADAISSGHAGLY